MFAPTECLEYATYVSPAARSRFPANELHGCDVDGVRGGEQSVHREAYCLYLCLSRGLFLPGKYSPVIYGW